MQSKLKKLSLLEFKELWAFKHQAVLTHLVLAMILMFYVVLDEALLVLPAGVTLILLYKLVRHDILSYQDVLIWEYLPPRRKADLIFDLRRAVAFPGFLYMFRILNKGVLNVAE